MDIGMRGNFVNERCGCVYRGDEEVMMTTSGVRKPAWRSRLVDLEGGKGVRSWKREL